MSREAEIVGGWLLGLALLFGGLAVCRQLPPAAPPTPAKAEPLQPDPVPPAPAAPPYRYLGTG